MVIFSTHWIILAEKERINTLAKSLTSESLQKMSEPNILEFQHKLDNESKLKWCQEHNRDCQSCDLIECFNNKSLLKEEIKDLEV